MTNISNNTHRKFIEEFDVADWEIETDTGFHNITSIKKTIKYNVWEIQTLSGRCLKCADTHIVFDKNMHELYVRDCIVGETYIQTKERLPELIVAVSPLNYKENMYDVSVESEHHRYYTNDILSHNTITTTAYLLWFVLFNSYKNIGILANKHQQSAKALARLQLAYEKLPFWLQQGVVTWNKGDIELENGSRIAAYSAGSDAARGESFSFLFIDECAFIAPNIFEDYYRSAYPTISSGFDTKICIVSTPNGLNHFYNLYKGAIEKTNAYMPFTAVWSDVPGRDKKWKLETIKNTSEESFLAEHNCEFIGGSTSLISSAFLRSIVPARVISSDFEGLTKIVEGPQQDRIYFLSADVARGMGLDYSAFSIIDITEFPYTQVATYRNNKISSLLYPNIIEAYAKRYNNAWVLVESNDIGESVLNILNWEFEYENLISTKTMSSSKSMLGLRTTTRTKRIGCNRFKDMVESHKLIITTDDTINELYHFQEKGGSYAADIGHDDLVMGLVNFSYYANTEGFNNLMNTNFREEYNKYMEQSLIEAMPPLPIMDNGINNEQHDYTKTGYIDGSHDSGFMS